MRIEDANKARIADYHDRLWGRGDLSVIDEVWHPEARVALADTADTALSAVRADAARSWGAFTDVTTEIRDLLAEGDRVVLHWATTGRHVMMAVIDTLTPESGRIVAAASMWDGLSVFDQLGVLCIGTQPAP